MAKRKNVGFNTKEKRLDPPSSARKTPSLQKNRASRKKDNSFKQEDKYKNSRIIERISEGFKKRKKITPEKDLIVYEVGSLRILKNEDLTDSLKKQAPKKKRIKNLKKQDIKNRNKKNKIRKQKLKNKNKNRIKKGKKK